MERITVPKAPTEAASVGEAMPSMMAPSTAAIRKTTGTKAVRVTQSFRDSGGASLLSAAGA